jgi:phage-related protein (TIGR01555 family)
MARSQAKRVSDIAAAPSPTVGRRPASSSVLQMDTLFNLVTGMGTSKDKSAATQFGFLGMNKAQLDMAYRGDWISRKVVDIPAYDATREWRSWQAEKTDITALEDLEHAMKLQKKTQMALQRARLYGGSAIIIGVNDGKAPEEMLDVESVAKDSLKWLHVVSRYELTSGPIDWTITSPYFGQPAYYQRTLQAASQTAADPAQQKEAEAEAKRFAAGGMIKIHPSRIVRFTGLETPEMNMSDGWGDSILQLCSDAVVALGTVSQAIASLVHEAKIDIVKIPELSERMSNKEYEKKLTDRFALAAMLKSIYSVMLLDKEEEWQRVEQTFTGMPEVLQAYMMMVCGAADIPATRFMGQSPQGMNATGDSDTRNYYDRVSTEQETVISPALEQLDEILQRSALGDAPDGLHYQWNPLWQMDEQQKADIETKRSTVVKADVDMGLIDPQVLQKARENQLIESGFYPGLEAIIEEYGTDINEREPTPEEQAAAAAAAALTGNGPPAANENDPNNPPAKGGKPPQPAPKAIKKQAAGAANDAAIGDMLKRMQDATTPRTLYVYRKVINWREIAAFYKKQDGIDVTVGEEMHVTVIYSKTAVDWLKVGEDNWSTTDDDGNLVIKAGGPRVMEKFGAALVLGFASSDLSHRHESAEYRAGCSYDYEDYTPHITITYQGGAVDILNMPTWTGQIVLGPEVFETINGSFDPDTLEEK